MTESQILRQIRDYIFHAVVCGRSGVGCRARVGQRGAEREGGERERGRLTWGGVQAHAYEHFGVKLME